MQCPSCEFQNMPGSGRCARCGSSLALATAVIDVNPPRAGRYARRMPRFWGLKQAWGNLTLSAGHPFAEYFARYGDTNFDLSTMVRLVVPGWATWYRGNNGRALVFLAAYCGLLLPAIVLLGTGLGSLLLGLAFGVHVASVVDAMVGRFAEFSDRLLFSLACSAGLLLCIYVPIGWAVSRVATPIQITQAIGDFRRGDVLWYDATSKVAAGDLVYYQVPETQAAGRTAGGGAANFVFQNGWINRVAAVGGQRVTWDDGKMYVDGVLSPWQGRVELSVAPGEAFVVPEGRVLIPAQGLVAGDVQLNAATWHRLSVVPTSAVNGRVFFRSAPFWRLSIID